MKFKIENIIHAPLDIVENAMLSSDYYKFLEKNHQGVEKIEVIEQNSNGDIISRKVKYTPRPIIEKVGPKKVPKEALVFTEHSTYDKKNHKLDFENIPAMNLIRERFKNKGVISFYQEENSTRRILEGELTVKFPLLGSIAERIIYSQAKKLLEEEIECFKRYIQTAPMNK